VSVGTRVRVQIAEREPQPETPFRRSQLLRGEVTRITPDTLLLRPAAGLSELAVPLTAVQRLDRSAGVPSRVVNALHHGIMGAIAGALWFGLTYQRGEQEYGVVNRGEATALGAGAGLLVGALWGALAPTERWREIRLSR
jgi:hypothetical protein